MTYLFICQSQRDRHCLETLYIEKCAHTRVHAPAYARQYNKNFSLSIFSTNGPFGIFFKKAVLKQDCNNARFFRLFLSCKRFIILSIILQADYSPQSCKRITKLSIILHKQDFTRRRRISSPRDFIKKVPFAFCEGDTLFFIICQARAFRPDS